MTSRRRASVDVSPSTSGRRASVDVPLSTSRRRASVDVPPLTSQRRVSVDVKAARLRRRHRGEPSATSRGGMLPRGWVVFSAEQSLVTSTSGCVLCAAGWRRGLGSSLVP
ncbi:uncharacterized protein LOC103788015 isoform X3 [Callithrix jacchus]